MRIAWQSNIIDIENSQIVLKNYVYDLRFYPHSILDKVYNEMNEK